MAYRTLVGALTLAGAAAATSNLVGGPLLGLSPARKTGSGSGSGSGLCNWDLEKDLAALSGSTLYNGTASVQAETSVGIELCLGVETLIITGTIGLSVADDFLTAPLLRLDLSGLELDLLVDLGASAAITNSIELATSQPLKIDLASLLGLASAEIDASFALDLVLNLTAAIDIRAGVKVSFGTLAYIEVDLLKQSISGHALSDLTAHAHAVEIGAGVALDAGVHVSLGLRLRTIARVQGDLTVLGDIGAGLVVGLWVDIADLFVHVSLDGVALGLGGIASSHPGPCGAFAGVEFFLSAALVVEVDMDVADIAHGQLAPAVSVILAAAVLIAPACVATGVDIPCYTPPPSPRTSSLPLWSQTTISTLPGTSSVSGTPGSLTSGSPSPSTSSTPGASVTGGNSASLTAPPSTSMTSSHSAWPSSAPSASGSGGNSTSLSGPPGASVTGGVSASASPTYPTYASVTGGSSAWPSDPGASATDGLPSNPVASVTSSNSTWTSSPGASSTGGLSSSPVTSVTGSNWTWTGNPGASATGESPGPGASGTGGNSAWTPDASVTGNNSPWASSPGASATGNLSGPVASGTGSSSAWPIVSAASATSGLPGGPGASATGGSYCDPGASVTGGYSQSPAMTTTAPADSPGATPVGTTITVTIVSTWTSTTPVYPSTWVNGSSADSTAATSSWAPPTAASASAPAPTGGVSGSPPYVWSSGAMATTSVPTGSYSRPPPPSATTSIVHAGAPVQRAAGGLVALVAGMAALAL